MSTRLPELNVDALKSISKDGDLFENYILHPKFLAKVFILAEKKENLKKFLTNLGFYSSENNPIKKIDIIRRNFKEFSKLIDKKGYEFLIPKKFMAGTSNLRNADILLKTEDEELRKLPYSLKMKRDLLKIKQDLVTEPGKKKDIQEYLNDYRFIFQMLIDSDEVAREINEGAMTIDVMHKDIKESSEKNSLWKLHINIDMSKDSKNSQEEVNIAYKILLKKAKKYGIKSLKLVAPFEKIDDMPGREVSVYLKSQNLEKDAENINNFISEVEKEFRKNNIIPTPTDKCEIANKKIKSSSYFSFRNEYRNNTRKYFSATDAKILTEFLNEHHKELADYYAVEKDKAEKLGILLSSLSLKEIENLYKITNVASSVKLSDFFSQNFKSFLEINIGPSMQDFFATPSHSLHNPFKLKDIFQLETLDLSVSPSLALPTTSQTFSPIPLDSSHKPVTPMADTRRNNTPPLNQLTEEEIAADTPTAETGKSKEVPKKGDTSPRKKQKK